LFGDKGGHFYGRIGVKLSIENAPLLPPAGGHKVPHSAQHRPRPYGAECHQACRWIAHTKE